MSNYILKPKLSGPNSSNISRRSSQTLVSIHLGFSPPFSQILFNSRIWQRNSVLATVSKRIQTVKLCLRSHLFYRYNKEDYKYYCCFIYISVVVISNMDTYSVLTASIRNQCSIKWSGIKRYVGHLCTHPSFRISGIACERSCKNLNYVVLVVSSKASRPRFRTGRFSQSAELSMPLTLLSNLVDQPGTTSITFEEIRFFYRVWDGREKV